MLFVKYRRYVFYLFIFYYIYFIMPENLSIYSDQELVDLFQLNGNNIYIGELFKRYSILVFGLCFKYLKNRENSKDAVHEIFKIVLESAKHQEIKYFRAWIYTISKNYLFRNSKKYNSLETIEIENFSEKFMENDVDLTLYKQEEQGELLQQALSNLNEEQRTCIELFYYQQKSYQEVASITGYDLNKVKSAIQNGKRNLKLFMEENKSSYEE
jgi:RNA polymerase sigma factor (sigma-70 family)